jgi:site-specific DNA-methyltransferase (adenine-specific)
MGENFLNGRVVLRCGDCREVMAGLVENSFDACVTDPPYHLTSIVKRMSAPDAAPVSFGSDGRYQRVSRGFMGKMWDGGDVAFDPTTWCAVWRVLKPGAHLIAFGGTRTYARMVVAIEDAGFEIRDTIAWLYGSGFPKSHNIGNGWGTALKPAMELMVLARKPLSEGTVAANVLKWGTGAINVGGCRIATDELTPRNNSGTATLFGLGFEGKATTVVPSPLGRWPANVTHDGSAEVTAAFPDCDGAISNGSKIGEGYCGTDTFKIHAREQVPGYADTGSAARFFYTSKADSDDRLGSRHPTVKPLDLMQWLVRLVTPPRGLVLDPFAGTGTTAEAAFREGMRCELIEAEAEYQADIRRRMALALAGPDERVRESIKARNLPRDDGPLFASRETWNDMWQRPFDWSKLEENHGSGNQNGS